MEKKRTDELTEFKANQALKARDANRRHRKNMKDKLTAATAVPDERMDDVLELLNEIKSMLEVDSETDEDSEDEPVQRIVKKKMKKLEDSDDDEPVQRVVKKKKFKKLEYSDDDEPVLKKKKIVKKVMKRTKPVAEVEPEDLGLQRKNPLSYNYPSYV